MEWTSVSIPKPLTERIRIIAPMLGYPGVAQFVAEAVRRHLSSKEREYGEIQLERETGRKVLGKE